MIILGAITILTTIGVTLLAIGAVLSSSAQSDGQSPGMGTAGSASMTNTVGASGWYAYRLVSFSEDPPASVIEQPRLAQNRGPRAVDLRAAADGFVGNLRVDIR